MRTRIKPINYDIRVIDNKIEITLKEGFEDNSKYKLTINNLMSLDGIATYNSTHEFCTEFSPFFCSIESVNALVVDCEIPEEIICFHIREASKQAIFKYIYPLKEDEIPPYIVEQFTRYRAAIDCLINYYIKKTQDAEESGKLGDVEYKNGKAPDISKLVDLLKDELKKWEDEVEGHGDKKAPPRFARRGGGIEPFIKNYDRRITKKRR